MASTFLASPGRVLYRNAVIVTVNKRREIILNGAMLTDGSRIVAIGKFDDVMLHQGSITKVVDCSGNTIVPGLINTHAHLAQSLLRGLAEDLPLHCWLCDAIWPLEANYEDDDGYVAAMLTIAEMLRSGTTCFLEAMLTHRSGFDNVVRAVEQTGIGACLVRPFDIIRETGQSCGISHNPTSNCKLGSEISPVTDMIATGINVAMGTNGAPCNNTSDMFREMHLAAILHSGVRQSAGVLPAYVALEMATINGARALGLDQDIGSLEVGKKADFIIVKPPAISTAPFDVGQAGDVGGHDPITVLVHSCTGTDVDTVVVDGVVVVEQGQVIDLDEAGIVRGARAAIQRIRDRSGVRCGGKVELNYV